MHFTILSFSMVSSSSWIRLCRKSICSLLAVICFCIPRATLRPEIHIKHIPISLTTVNAKNKTLKNNTNIYCPVWKRNIMYNALLRYRSICEMFDIQIEWTQVVMSAASHVHKRITWTILLMYCLHFKRHFVQWTNEQKLTSYETIFPFCPSHNWTGQNETMEGYRGQT